MNNKIKNTVEKYNMLSLGDKVLVAVSGGADSMLLLNHLVSLADYYGISVAVAHVEHGIRGQESIDDALFVSQYCSEHNIEFHQLSIDAVNEAKELKMGVEEYSRKRRYEFFDSIDCDKIATAHNLSDNVETVLFRLSRGTGLKGMCGIPAVRGKIIRPLIEISSEDIRQFCSENGIPFRVDSTNSSSDYSRNYIRNEVLPVIKKQCPNFENSVYSFICDANEDMSFIDGFSNTVYNECLSNGRLSIEHLLKYEKAIIKRVILKYFSDYSVTVDRIHLDKIIEHIEKQGKIQIKGNIYAVINGGQLYFADLSQKETGYSFVSEILNISEFDPKGVDFYCDCDKIIGQVKFRTRIDGDRISPANRGCTKSLKKLFNELKIPPHMRDSIGIVVDDKGIIGVIGFCADERVKLDSGTKKVLSVKISSGGLVNE